MVNHMYWCVLSTSGGDGDAVVAKWLSLENHIHNKHTGHSKLYAKCTHGRLLGQVRAKKWFKRRKLNACMHTIFYDKVCYYRFKGQRKNFSSNIE